MRRPRMSIRWMMVAFAVFGVSLAWAIQGWRAWDFDRRRPASTALLRPLIVFHGLHASSYRTTSREELRIAIRRSQGLVRKLARAVRFALGTRPGAQPPPEVDEAKAFVRRLALRRPTDQGPTVLENLRDAIWAAHMGELHEHVMLYYMKLLNERCVVLPPLPPELEAELKTCEAELRRNRRDPTLDLYNDTAPDLRPGAAPSKSPAASVGSGDSY